MHDGINCIDPARQILARRSQRIDPAEAQGQHRRMLVVLQMFQRRIAAEPLRSLKRDPTEDASVRDRLRRCLKPPGGELTDEKWGINVGPVRRRALR